MARKKIERKLWMAHIVRDGRPDHLPRCLVDGNALQLFHRLESDECTQRSVDMITLSSLLANFTILYATEFFSAHGGSSRLTS